MSDKKFSFNMDKESLVSKESVLDEINSQKEIKELSALLEEAKSEIDFLVSEAKQPIQQSKASYKKRQGDQIAALNKRYNEYFDKLQKVIDVYNERINEINKLLDEGFIEYNRIKKREEDLNIKEAELNDAKNRQDEEFETVKHDFLNNAEEEKQKFINEYMSAIADATTKKNAAIDNAEKTIMDAIEKLENEKKEYKEALEKEKKEFMDKYNKMIEDAQKDLIQAKLDAEKELEAINKEYNETKLKKECIIKDIEELEEKANSKNKYLEDISKIFKKKNIVIGISIIILISILSFLFHPYLFAKAHSYTAVSAILGKEFNESNITLLATVNNQTIFKGQLFHGINDYLGEEYTTFELSDQQNEFIWERYNKGDSVFMKTPYEPQYIYSEDYKDNGLRYVQNEVGNIESDLINKLISEIDVSEIYVSGREEDDNVVMDFLKYWKNKIIPNTIHYQFNVSPDLVSEVYSTISASSAYRNFAAEEAYFQGKLEVDDAFGALDDLLTTVFVNSQYTEADGRFTINDGKLDEIIVNFHGTNANGENISIFITVNLNIIDKSTSYDNSEFLLNSMDYTKIYPRIEQDTFKETENAQQIQENITTVTDLEERGFQFN